MHHKQVAVCISCYNRRDITLSCLAALYEQDVPFQLYLVDDNSSDGTSAAVHQSYPDVQILSGDGNLYWVGGIMSLAFAKAMEDDYEYCLWLNDDTLLEPNALNTLLDTHNLLSDRGKPDSIIVGSVKDPVTGQYSYGGRVHLFRV